MEVVDSHMRNKANTVLFCFKEHIKEMLLFLACGVFLSKVNLRSFEIKEKNIKKAINLFISYIQRIQNTASSKGSFSPTSFVLIQI